MAQGQLIDVPHAKYLTQCPGRSMVLLLLVLFIAILLLTLKARQNISRERDDELLARQASMASRRARTFATLLGQADAWAAKNDSEGDERAEATETEGRLSSQPLREVSEELECPRPTPHRTSADKTGAATADTITTTDTTTPENRERVSE